MSVVEIEAPSRLAQPTDPLPDAALVLTSATLGLPAAPGFLSEPTAVAAESGGTLWDRLRLSWTDPQTMRDLLGAGFIGGMKSDAAAAPSYRIGRMVAGPPVVSAHLRGTE